MSLADQKPTINWSKGIIDWHLSKDLEKTRFLAFGDVLLDRSALGMAVEGNKEIGNILFGDMHQAFCGADIVMGNLENPLSNRGSPIFKYGPNFRAPPNMAEILREAGFTVMGVANNHVRDYGDIAFLDTLKSLRNQGISTVGGGRDRSSASKPLIVRKHGMSIGMLAFTYRQESIAGVKGPGSADLDDPGCYTSVKALSDEVDVAVVYLHLDGEYSSYPAPYRMNAARRFVDLGACLVIGHHPHVPQGIEIYKNRLIAYSLGNFIFRTDKRRPLTGLGYALKAELTQRGPSSVAIIPYRITPRREPYRCACQPTPLSNTDHQDFMAHLRLISNGLGDTSLVTRNWEQFAIRDAMALSRHVMKGVLSAEEQSLWSSHFALLKQRCPIILKRLITGKMPKDIKSAFAERVQG